MDHSKIEEEVIFLKATWDIINSIVNYEIVNISEGDPHFHVYFKSSITMRIFNIILTDFLSPTDREAPVEQKPYLRALKEIIQNPNFNEKDSINFLKTSIISFDNWLNYEAEIEIYFRSLDIQKKIKIRRIDFIKIFGNLSKHNFLRAIGVSKLLTIILNKNGITVNETEAIIALEDIEGVLSQDIVAYHSSTLIEFLNNIRWGIYEYLSPEYQRSYYHIEDIRYGFRYPEKISSDIAKHSYWDLMNKVGHGPWIKSFKISPFNKGHY